MVLKYTIQRPAVTVGALLRVPKAWVDVERLQHELTVQNGAYWTAVQSGAPSDDRAAELVLYEDHGDELWVPRHYKVPYTRRGARRFEERQGSIPFRLWTPPPAPEGVEHFIVPRNNVQRRGSRALQRGSQDRMLAMACGAGKGLPNDSRVLTPGGWSQVSSIQEGDCLVGSDGKPTRVTGVYPQGVRQLYRICFSDDTSVTCDDQHLWWLDVDRRGPRVVSTEDLYFGEPQRRGGGRHSLKNRAGLRYALELCAPIRFRKKKLLIDPWVLGAWLGDGSYAVITNPELDIQIRLLLRIPGSRFVPEGDRCGGVRVTKTPLNKQQLKTLGLYKLRSHERYVPSEYLRGSVRQRVSLLQGLFDTDGHVSDSGNRVEYSTTSPRLKDAVIDLVRSLGGIATVSDPKRGRYKKDGRHTTTKVFWRVWATFPRGDFVPVSSKKHLARWNPKYQRKRKYVTRVDQLGSGGTTCFRVSATDSLFVAEGYNLTHNTVVSLHAAVEAGKLPLLIVVHTNALMGQWRAAVEQFYGDSDYAKAVPVGHIQQKICEWDGYPVAVAMLHTLVRRRYSPEFYEYWRLVIVDETHRLGCEAFSPLAAMFPCERWGLSATIEREDKMDRVFRLHLGEVAYEYLDQPLKPHVYFLKTGIAVDEKSYMFRRGRINLSRLVTDLSDHEVRNSFILHWIEKAVQKGRTILVLGERLTQLHWMNDTCAAASKALHIGSMNQQDRDWALEQQVVFATQQLAKEGLDRPKFDTLFILIPFGGEGRLRQSIGRILRTDDDKKPPLVFIVEDQIGIMLALSRKMKRHLQRLEFPFNDVKKR